MRPLPIRILAQSAAVAQTKQKRRAIAMRKITIGLVVLGVLALAFISMPMRAQNQGYPPEFSPLRTFRTPPAQRSLVPAACGKLERNPKQIHQIGRAHV